MITPLRINRITPVPHEPGRFWVPNSNPEEDPWMVDLDNDGKPGCSCQILYNRTEKNFMCHHIRDVMKLKNL